MRHGAVVPYPLLVRQFEQAPPGKIFCLHGDASVFRLSLTAVSNALLREIPIALIDGTNRFDVYSIAEFARRVAYHGAGPPGITPGQLLERIYIARAFTCYQMEATITERLPEFLRQRQLSVAVIFGLLDTFYDDQAPFFEVKESLRRICAVLRRLRRQNIALLLASQDVRPASKERAGLFPMLASAVDRVFRVAEREGRPEIIGALPREVSREGEGRTTTLRGG